MTIGALKPDDVLVDLRPVGSEPRVPNARVLAPSDAGTFARSAPAQRVVLLSTDGHQASAVAERLSALGVNAAWLDGGARAWGRA